MCYNAQNAPETWRKPLVDIYTEVGRAYLVLKPGSQPNEDEFRDYCRKHLANFKVPRAFEMQAALPLLPNGKVDKQALRRQFAER